MSVDDDQSFMSIIDQVKVDVMSPMHDSDNARQLEAVSRCLAPEMHTPQLTRKEAALIASGSMTNQLVSCTAYQRTTHPFGAVKKNLACANTGLRAVTEWQDIVKITWHGTDSIMLNLVNIVANCAICPLGISGNGPFSTWTNYPFSNWTNHPFPIGQSAIPPLTELVVWKNEDHLTKQPQPLDNAPSAWASSHVKFLSPRAIGSLCAVFPPSATRTQSPHVDLHILLPPVAMCAPDSPSPQSSISWQVEWEDFFNSA
ncbi:hypothetical protein EDC04DRAFT_2604212 [Pisolithus marmoratus]|nr:hypothetical protein EDC04DRAFT_2604212 [Pisolithus marmoratus]